MQCKRQPTAAEQKRFDQMHERGCVPCWLHAVMVGRRWEPEPADIHHVDQSSHLQTYANCPWHHRGVPKNDMSLAEMRSIFGPSMAKDPESYRAWYGSESDLLAYQAKLLLKSPHRKDYEGI